MSVQADLLGIFNRRDPDGSFHYSTEDVKNVLPVVILGSPLAADLGALDADVQRMVADFLIALGVDLTHPDPADFEARLEQRWCMVPPNPELMQELRTLMLDLRSGSASTSAFARFSATLNASPSGNSAVAEGAIKSSPSARVRLLAWKDD